MILFIDDEPRIMESYWEYLKLKLEPYKQEVVFQNNVDEALSFFEKHTDEIDLVILDIMMPTGERFNSEKTNGGLKTGLVFYKKIREVRPKLPIIFFTNFSDESVETELRHDPQCSFLQKVNYLLDDFVDEVKKSLNIQASEG